MFTFVISLYNTYLFKVLLICVDIHGPTGVTTGASPVSTLGGPIKVMGCHARGERHVAPMCLTGVDFSEGEGGSLLAVLSLKLYKIVFFLTTDCRDSFGTRDVTHC